MIRMLSGDLRQLARPLGSAAVGLALLGAVSCSNSASDHDRESSIAAPNTTLHAGDAASLPALPSRLAPVIESLRPGIFDCPDRVWPGLSGGGSKARILFTSRKANGAWSFAAGAVKPVDIAPLGDEWFALFHNGQLEGVPTLGIALDEMDRLNDLDHTPGRPDFALTISPHEAFHYFGQMSWRIDDVERRARFPEPWRPAFLRNALVESVRAAVRTPGGVTLGHASAYWHELHEQYGDELLASRSLDVLEGSAEYATLMTLALADVGCDASDDALQAAALARVDALVGSKAPYRDGYDIGVVAGVLLRPQGNAWTADVERGTPPIEMLLKDIAPVAPNARGELEAEMKRIVAGRNAKRAPVIEAMKRRLASRDHVRIVVSGAWIEGSYQSDESVRLLDNTGVSTVYPGVRARFSTGEDTSVRVTGHTVAEGVANPCGIRTAWLLTVPATSLKEASGRFSASTETVVFDRLPAKRIVEQRRTWLCAQAPADG